VYAGSAFTCVILNDSSVKCWGWNNSGQLGSGAASTSTPDYIGGTVATTPDLLAAVPIFGPWLWGG